MSTAASSTSGSNNNTTPRRHHTPGRRVVRTLNGEQLSISIPDNFHQQHLHLTQHLQQQQQQFQQQPGSVSSMMVSPALPSPNFSNFMLTLSPLMQLSSPQPTMSPRDDMSATGGVPSNMTPMVSTADEISFAFQASNDAAPTTTPATTSSQAAAAPPLAPPPLPTHALMPPPPPRVRPPREQEQHHQQHGQHHEHEHHHHHQQQQHEEQHAHHQQQQEQHEQQQQQQQQQQRLLQGEEEERDPHNHHLPAAQGSALGNGNGNLADKFHLMQMGVVDAGGLMEGKGSLLGPATPTMQGVVMEGYPRSLAMGMGGGAEAFGNSDGEEEEGEEEEGESGAEEGVFGGRLGRRVVHRHHAHRRGSEDAEEEEEIYEAEGGGYISSSSSDGTKSTMEHLQHDQRDLHSSQHQPHYSTSPAASAFARRHGQGPSAAAVAAAAAAASSRSRGSSSSIHKKTGSSSGGGSNSASRPVRSAAAARRHSHTQEMRRSPPPGAMAGGLPHPQARVSPSGTVSVATGPKKCNCRKSKCLKLYCECFAVGAYCQDDCGCLDCNNTLAFEHVRTQAVDSILSRNPHAFTEKIQFIEAGATGAVAAGGAGRRATLAGGLRGDGGEKTVMGGMQGSAGGMLPTAAHVRGCNCKKSLCIKKYCECFFAGVYCGENCQCEGCQNNHEASAGVHAIKKRASGNATKQKQQQQQQQQLEASPSPSGPPSLSPTHEMIGTTSL